MCNPVIKFDNFAQKYIHNDFLRCDKTFIDNFVYLSFSLMETLLDNHLDEMLEPISAKTKLCLIQIG